MQNTLLSAVLTFSDQPLYSYYVERPRLGNLSPLDDQAAAGVLMWVPGSLAYLVPLFVIGIRLLFGAGRDFEGARPSPRRDPRGRPSPGRFMPAHHRPAPLLGSSTAAFDLLRVPLLGRFLRWRHARLSLQVPLLLLAGLIVYDGFRGPQSRRHEPGRRAPLDSLARPGGPGAAGGRQRLLHGLPVHGAADARPALAPAGPELAATAAEQMAGGRLARGLPLGLRGVRSLGQPMVDRLDRPGLLRGGLRHRRLLSRCILLQVCLPDRPVQLRAVAHLAAGSHGARPGRLCFVPDQGLHPRDETTSPDASSTCSSRGSRATWTARSASTVSTPALTTTSASLPARPGKSLWRDPFRSGIGRFSKRPDLAALIVVLTFGAFVNAAGMVAPVLEWRDRLASLPGLRSPLLVTSLSYVVGLVVLPVLMVGASAALCRRLGRLPMSTLEVATRFSYAMVPLGFSMWLAHYSFHFLTSLDAAIPAFQRFAGDLGLGHPRGAGVGTRLLPARRGLASPAGDPVPRFRVAPLAVFGLSDRTVSSRSGHRRP